MTRTLRLAIAASALLLLTIGASPAWASGGAEFGACVAHHAKAERGFTADHNPGAHQGFAGWPGCSG